MTRKILAFIFVLSFVGFLPAAAAASTLTTAQTSAIVGLLEAFNVAQAIVDQVERILTSAAAPAAVAAAGAPDPVAATSTPPVPHVPVIGSLYPSSSVGYDLSFNTRDYPVMPFGFAVVGVTGGKAYVESARLASEFSWARLAASVRPTLYMNLNAPYGSTATDAHLSSPKTCGVLFFAATSSAGAYPEPTVCAAYNYGFNAAADAFAYATKNSVSSPFWWLDIEEANSWSDNVAVNDATIQGAIDYLNAQGIRVGLYSVPSMWRNIAGASFTPTQAIGGSAVPIPNWFPVGIMTQVSAINSCLTAAGFTNGSPVWIVQYEANSTAVDQNIAC
ncbi:MAG TPA: hypothetical protein VMV50_01115 [Candidatus Paceibacterota bacterium]|nr:hypothetical protein [Candidatus Paceibacterota bacterium]